MLYRLREEYIYEIYQKWPSGNQNRDFILIAKVRRRPPPNPEQDAIQKVPQLYSNEDFFRKREEIQAVMSQAVNRAFKANYAECIAVIMTDVSLDSTFENSLINQQVILRQAETAMMQQTIDTLEGEIAVIASSFDTQV